jgi:hypothetical protein
LAVNATKVTADGAVCVLGVGRRTITTKNAYQKMVKPTFGGKSSWNSFVRVYASDFSVPKYSSLVVGQWDTLTQTGGDNTQLFGVWKTPQGIVAVGRHTADANNIAKGNALPVINVPTWASNAPQGESAVLVYYSAQNLYNPLDSVQQQSVSVVAPSEPSFSFETYPNPTQEELHIKIMHPSSDATNTLFLYDCLGRIVFSTPLHDTTLQTIHLPSTCSNGIYILKIGAMQRKIRVQR